MSAKYWIAQHISDLFRNEPRNIGVFVDSDGLFSARFVGENEAKEIDRRKLKSFQYPEVYEQWIKYWRKQIETSSIESIIGNSGSHYRVIAGGVVDDVAADGLDDVTNYLYALLVSSGGFYQALGVSEEEPEATALADDVVDAFKQVDLLATDKSTVPHPIRRGVPVIGKIKVEHKPAFVQENGTLYVMETVDFTTPRKRISRDHAGWTAYMFKDVCAARPNTAPIAIVRFTQADQDNEDVHNGLALLRNEGQVVNWLQDDQRGAFLDKRREVALA